VNVCLSVFFMCVCLCLCFLCVRSCSCEAVHLRVLCMCVLMGVFLSVRVFVCRFLLSDCVVA